jgi:hypothetical protein
MAAELSFMLGLPWLSPQGLSAPVLTDSASIALLLLLLPMVRLLLLEEALPLPPSCTLLLRPLPLRYFWLVLDRL